MLEGLKIDLLAENVDILLISGDLSILGSRETHEDVARILSGIEETGVQVFITSGNHDVNNPDALRITENGSEPIPWTTPEEFKEIYADFGYTEGVMVHDESLSYMAYLDDDIALLSLDTAYYQNNAFLDHSAALGVIVFSLYPWVDEALARAEADGHRVIAMSHHNFLRHYEVDRDLSNFMVNDEGQMLSQLTNAGVEVALSGHIHKSDTKTEELEGKPFTGVVTTSLALYPHSYKILGFTDDRVGITTRLLPLPYSEEENEEILEYNRKIGLNRTFYGRELRYTEEYSQKDAEAIAWFFHIANLYSQQGLEAYIPEEILESRTLQIVDEAETGMLGFMKSLPLDTEPNDWDTVLMFTK